MMTLRPCNGCGMCVDGHCGMKRCPQPKSKFPKLVKPKKENSDAKPIRSRISKS